jgi:hypothetical protein
MLPTRSLELDYLPRSIWFGALPGELGAVKNVLTPFVNFHDGKPMWMLTHPEHWP